MRERFFAGLHRRARKTKPSVTITDVPSSYGCADVAANCFFHSWPRVGSGETGRRIDWGRLHKLWKVHSRLYRSQVLQAHTYFGECFQIYKVNDTFALLHTENTVYSLSYLIANQGEFSGPGVILQILSTFHQHRLYFLRAMLQRSRKNGKKQRLLKNENTRLRRWGRENLTVLLYLRIYFGALNALGKCCLRGNLPDLREISDIFRRSATFAGLFQNKKRETEGKKENKK